MHVIIPYLHHSNYGSFTHTLDHVQAESEIQAEQAEAEASTNFPFLSKRQALFIPPKFLSFLLKLYFIKSLIVH
jgi:hypothetical protein